MMVDDDSDKLDTMSGDFPEFVNISKHPQNAKHLQRYYLQMLVVDSCIALGPLVGLTSCGIMQDRL